MAKRKKKKRKRSANWFGTLAVSFVVIILAVTISYSREGLKEKNEAYKEREALLERQIKEELEREQELEEYSKYVQTKKYIEEVARDKLGLVYKDEIIFKPDNQ